MDIRSKNSDFYLAIMTGWTSKFLDSSANVWSFLVVSKATFALNAGANLRHVTFFIIEGKVIKILTNLVV
jgi:hypothetical protein